MKKLEFWFRTSLAPQEMNVMKIMSFPSSNFYLSVPFCQRSCSVVNVLFTLPRNIERVHFLTFLIIKLRHMTQFWPMDYGWKQYKIYIDLVRKSTSCHLPVPSSLAAPGSRATRWVRFISFQLVLDFVRVRNKSCLVQDMKIWCLLLSHSLIYSY